MSLTLQILVGCIAFEHIVFLILEMFLFAKPFGQRIFRTSPELASGARMLAANQGLYNGFLAAGLIYALLARDPNLGHSLAGFFLGCVAVAGVFGAATVSARIFWIQALPAIGTLVVLIGS